MLKKLMYVLNVCWSVCITHRGGYVRVAIQKMCQEQGWRFIFFGWHILQYALIILWNTLYKLLLLYLSQ
ncbi:hypothetical protein DKP78_24565, partial [Enterococcus faecium]